MCILSRKFTVLHELELEQLFLMWIQFSKAHYKNKFQRKHKQMFLSLYTDRKKMDCKSILVCAWERTVLHVCDQTILSLCPDVPSVLDMQPMVGEQEVLLETCYVFH